MWETIAVIAIVAVSTFIGARALWCTLARRDAGCSACGMCPRASECGKGAGPGSAAAQKPGDEA